MAPPHTHVGLLGNTFSCTCCCPEPSTPLPEPSGWLDWLFKPSEPEAGIEGPCP